MTNRLLSYKAGEKQRFNTHDVQMATDHPRLDSVKKYAKVEVSARKALLERRKVVRIEEHVPNTSRKVYN